ncbi:MAG: DUF6249 domain-containing protein, partial [Ktedonobacterales bacterium]
ILLIRYLDHRERMTMIAHGLTPPDRHTLPRASRSTAVLRGGLITAAVGIAITLGLYTVGYVLPAPFSAVPGRFGPWLLPGLIPTGVGVALVLSYYLAPPRAAQPDTDATAQSDETPETRRPGLRVLDAHDTDDAAHG